MKVKFYCGMYRGPVLDWNYEPAECCNEGIIEVDEEDWEDNYVSHVCEQCGNEIYQSDDHFEKLEVTA